MAGGVMVEQEAALAALRAAVAQVQGLDLSTVDGVVGPSLHRELSRLSGQVQAVAARVLARVEADGRWQGTGARTFGEWAARRVGSSVGAAKRDAELGRALDELPHTAGAVAGGRLPLEHAQILARASGSSEVRRSALRSDDARVNEQALLVRAGREGADEFRRTVQRWAYGVDHAAAEAEHERACSKEYLALAPRADGVALQGFLTREHGAALTQALRAIAGVPAADDPRSREERQASALVGAARVVLDRGLAGSGQSVRPHLTVTVSFESLRRQVAAAAAADGERGREWLPEGWASWVDPEAGCQQPAELEDGSPIPASVLARLACDSELTRVVFGPDDEVLDLGRSARVYTGQQRRAVIARDRSCRYPGCGAPPSLGEVHHADWWVRDHGGTSVARGVLLCWYQPRPRPSTNHQRDARCREVEVLAGSHRDRRPDLGCGPARRRLPARRRGPARRRPPTRGRPPGPRPAPTRSRPHGPEHPVRPGRTRPRRLNNRVALSEPGTAPRQCTAAVGSLGESGHE